MKNCDPNIRWGLHIIKVSFQRWDYKGYVTFIKSDNCKELDILKLKVDDLYDKKFKENPINLRSLGAGDDGEEWFAVTLKNNEDELFIRDEWKCLKGHILDTEVIDFK